MANPLSLLFTNRTSRQLVLADQRILGAVWSTPLPEVLPLGTTGGPYGSVGADSGYSGSLSYQPEGAESLVGLSFEISNDGRILLTPSGSPPFEVLEKAFQDGDLWIVRLVFLRRG